VVTNSNKTAAEMNLALKAVRLESAEMALRVRKNELCLRSAVMEHWMANAHSVRGFLMEFPSLVRQKLQLTLDDQSAIETIVDASMAKWLAEGEAALAADMPPPEGEDAAQDEPSPKAPPAAKPRKVPISSSVALAGRRCGSPCLEEILR
jgi:hypothetical protein